MIKGNAIATCFLALVLCGCMRSDDGTGAREALAAFLDAMDARTLKSMSVEQVFVFQASKDYTFTDYMALLACTYDDFRRVISTDGFTGSVARTLPTARGYNSFPIPEWWRPTYPPREVFSRSVGSALILLVWEDGTLYLYGHN